MDFSRKKITQIIKGHKPKSIIVVGDLMLDQYTWGKVERISPEAPIPVFHVEKEEYRLGGAANTVANIATLENRVFPIGLIGKDLAGEKVMSILEEQNIATEGIVVDDQYTTIQKNRVITYQQQLVRIDRENRYEITSQSRKKVCDAFDQLIGKADAVVISNYNKGLLDRDLIQYLIQEARTKNVPVVCDPGKGVDLSCYKGATTIKPNKSETKNYTNEECNSLDSILKAAQKIQESCRTDFLSISLDKDGILYFKDIENYQIYKTDAREVFDVTGAGDMVISILAIMLASGVDHDSTIKLANIAAGLEIMHVGVVSLRWDEILNFIQAGSSIQKIKPLGKIIEELEELGDTPILFTNGYFDSLSAGHLRFLQEIENYPGKLVVAINSDESIQRQKKEKPILDQMVRARLLASLENVYRVVIFDEDDTSNLIESIKPDQYFKGSGVELKNQNEKKALEKHSVKVNYLQRF